VGRHISARATNVRPSSGNDGHRRLSAVRRALQLLHPKTGVDNAQRVLLVKRRENGQWEPPGGVLEHGETITAGLRREVREETGLDIEPGPITGIYQNMRANRIVFAFRCQPIGGSLTPSEETSDFRWARADELASITTEVFATRLLDGLAYTGPPPLRFHDGEHLL
jgi:ADP-ribose pyrophosphatase YjhB (NUDIX family)